MKLLIALLFISSSLAAQPDTMKIKIHGGLNSTEVMALINSADILNSADTNYLRASINAIVSSQWVTLGGSDIGYTGGVKIGSGSISSAAIFDIGSTTKGVLFPRMTTIQMAAIPSPPDGLIIYNLTTHSFWWYDGTEWQGM